MNNMFPLKMKYSEEALNHAIKEFHCNVAAFQPPDNHTRKYMFINEEGQIFINCNDISYSVSPFPEVSLKVFLYPRLGKLKIGDIVSLTDEDTTYIVTIKKITYSQIHATSGKVFYKKWFKVNLIPKYQLNILKEMGILQ